MKYMMKLLAASLLCFSMSVVADESNDFDASLLDIQHTWAFVNYEHDGDQQEIAFKSLLEQAKSFTVSYPNEAEAWIWRGIIESSYAGAKGGLGALSLAKKAKKSLEKAIDIDDNALMGSAYTSLGILYHKVPGWPISFGDDDDAKVMLDKALSINPEGIDPNYFYGEYFYDKGDYKLAITHLEKAQNAKPRSTRPVADKYRHDEIKTLLAKVNKKLNK